MRAWLFILAVLATLQITTQVASTEEQQKTLHNRNHNQNQDSSSLLSSSSSSTYSLPVIVDASTSKLSDSLSDTEADATSDVTSKASKEEEENSISHQPEKPALKPDTDFLVKFKEMFLSVFQLKGRPKNLDLTKIVIPDHLKKLYAEMMGQEFDSTNIPRSGLHTGSANTVTAFTHRESKIDKRFPHHHKFRLSFNLSSIPENEKLKAAELQINRDAIDLSKSSSSSSSSSDSNSIVDLGRTRYQVFVYDILRVGIKGQREPSFRLIDTKHILLNTTDVLSFDVQPAVERWLATPKANHGLLIEVRTSSELKPAPHHHVRLRRSLDEHDEVWLKKQPILYTYTDDERLPRRERRDVSSKSSSSSHHHNQHQHQKRTKRQNKRRSNKRVGHHEACQRKPLYVDFSEVGWSDWIVAPNGYDAYFCGGECPKIMSAEFNTTNHAILQQMINQNNPEKVPKACCVPTQLAPVSMLYLNEDNHVVLKSYQDMAVVGCGCR